MLNDVVSRDWHIMTSSVPEMGNRPLVEDPYGAVGFFARHNQHEQDLIKVQVNRKHNETRQDNDQFSARIRNDMPLAGRTHGLTKNLRVVHGTDPPSALLDSVLRICCKNPYYTNQRTIPRRYQPYHKPHIR